MRKNQNIEVEEKALLLENIDKCLKKLRDNQDYLKAKIQASEDLLLKLGEEINALQSTYSITILKNQAKYEETEEKPMKIHQPEDQFEKQSFSTKKRATKKRSFFSFLTRGDKFNFANFFIKSESNTLSQNEDSTKYTLNNLKNSSKSNQSSSVMLDSKKLEIDFSKFSQLKTIEETDEENSTIRQPRYEISHNLVSQGEAESSSLDISKLVGEEDKENLLKFNQNEIGERFSIILKSHSLDSINNLIDYKFLSQTKVRFFCDSLLNSGKKFKKGFHSMPLPQSGTKDDFEVQYDQRTESEPSRKCSSLNYRF